MKNPPQITDEVAEIHMAYKRAFRKCPRKLYRIYKQVRATYLLLIMFILQEAFFNI